MKVCTKHKVIFKTKEYKTKKCTEFTERKCGNNE